ncbi:hypothetical protein AWB80_03112 [Caballeronia pedi]|uniref:Uncharacterized protein n=1 Tax=Caballeronia pedi TaxID=1777141 RepID=A0A158B729_9BURK|nr:hypothetical protein [Caballeronia pedi]SAK65863.1 hypothetical protein AWB80_03112 [Caballeronia pedi]
MSNNISTVRQHLLDTLADLRNRENPMEVERARAVADVARVLVDSAKVEVDFIRATDATGSGFLQQPEHRAAPAPELPTPVASKSDIERTPTGLVHRIKG